MRLERLEVRELLAADVIISEFMASNKTTLADKNSSFPDWIELHNTTVNPISLNGWFLTDSAGNLNQWQFPNVSLGPQGYLVVYASGDNIAIAGQELHTNFKLGANGSYLALVRPDGITIESEFTPKFPNQLEDVSYGVTPRTTTLVGPTAVGRYLVPDASTPANWNSAAFSDLSWAGATGPIGYDTVSSPQAPAGSWNVDAQLRDAGGLAEPLSLSGKPVFTNDTPAALGGGKSLLLNGVDELASAKVDVSETSYTVSFWFKTDSPNRGLYMAANGALGASGKDRQLYLTANGSIAAQVLGTSNETITSSGTNYADNNWHHVVHVFDQTNVAQTLYVDGVQVATGTVKKSTLIAQDRLLFGFALDALNDYFKGSLDDMAVWNTALSPGQIQALYAGRQPSQLALGSLIGQDVQGALKGVNGSIYYRTSFVVDAAATLVDPVLRLRYDDGFVAYLDGTEVARRNAPASPAWNSNSASGRSYRSALITEEVDLSGFKSLLTPGTHVLAIQGLNASPGDGEFFLAPQLVDVDYSSTTEHYYASPSPGAANLSSDYATVQDTKFSQEHGFFDAPFNLTISTATAGATIRYTLDGSLPSESNGLTYTGPLNVAATTIVRALAIKPGFQSSRVDTATYVFVNDVILQQANGKAPAGYPAGNVNGQTLNWGMDPDIVNNPKYSGDVIKNALKAIPSFSIVTDKNNLFDSKLGIYVNAGVDGQPGERPASVELVYPDGTKGFQINAGLRIRGGFSRSGDNPKHAFRLFFNSDYDGKLSYPVFGPDAAQTFAKFDLRTSQNYSWSFQNDARETFARDSFNRLTQLAMGDPGEHGTWYHLYVNGMYWGLYETDERPEANFGADYSGAGGSNEDYDTIKVSPDDGYTIYATDGTMDEWTKTVNASAAIAATGLSQADRFNLYMKIQGLNPDGTRNPSYPVYIDVDNLIDYMMIAFYGGNLDAPISNFLSNTSPNNWFGTRNRNGTTGWIFMAHDSEHTLLNVNENRLGPYNTPALNKTNPQWINQQLMLVDEFRLRWADRIQKFFFNGGVFTPEGANATLDKITTRIDQAVIAESARWGDSKRAAPYTREDWLNAINTIRTQFFPNRPAVMINQFRNAKAIGNVAAPLFPTLLAPVFSKRGGVVDPGTTFSLSAEPVATIYFTTDGSDPRLLGGAVSPTAQIYSGPITINDTRTIRVRAKNGAIWSPIDEATFAIDTSALRITEMMYRPSLPQDGVHVPDDYEFIELQNTGSKPFDLQGVQFIHGITYTFPDAAMAPGQYVVLVKNPAAFAAAYPGVPIFGTYEGTLSDNGEQVTLISALGTTLLDFVYSDQWYPQTDGGGYSLAINNPKSAPNTWGLKESWHASAALGGNPGAGDDGLFAGAISINEVLANTSGADGQKIELHNLSSKAIDISNWWLSNDELNLKKYRFPAGTLLAGGGYLVLSELADFGSLTNPNAVIPFRLDVLGSAVELTSGFADGSLGGYREDKNFGPSDPEVPFAVYLKSLGGTDFVAESSATFGAANAAPKVGPIVLNELMYHPKDGSDEYLELRNITGDAVPLYDPAAPTHAWKFTDGIIFSFPAGATLPGNSYALVVPIAPADFRAKYHIPAEVQVFGPYLGALNNGGDRVTLAKPTSGGGTLAYINVDSVNYASSLPWPTYPDRGLGASLGRVDATKYANDVINWQANSATPGAANVALDGTPPTTPGSVTATLVSISQAQIAWAASTDLETGVATYQVFRNGMRIGTTTQTSFTDNLVLPGANSYQINAVNGDGIESPLSTPAITNSLGISYVTDQASPARVVVSLSEPVTSGTATPANFLISGGVAVTAVSLSSDGLTASLTTSALTAGTTYRVELGAKLTGTSGRKPSPGAVAFFTAGPGTGLKGEYYDNADFTSLKLMRNDGSINFDFGAGSPDPTIGSDSFSVRWTGQAKAQTTDRYTFFFSSDEQVRVWFDGVLRINNVVPHAVTEDSFQLDLIANRKYDIQVEYVEGTGPAVAKLSWQAAGIAKQIVPQTALFPPAAVIAPDTTTVATLGANGTLLLPVHLTAPTSQPVLVAFNTSDGTATDGSDYNSVSGTLTIAPGATAQFIPITILPDVGLEPSESFQLKLNSVVGAPVGKDQAIVTILPAPTISVADATVVEGDSGLANGDITVSLSAPSTQQITVAYNTVPGTATANVDYFNTSGTVTFAPGTTTANIRVIISADKVAEANETVFLDLSSGVNALIGRARGTLTIIDNDSVPAASVNDVSVPEGNTGTTNLVFTVSLSSAPSAPVVLNYATADGTATASSDYAAASGILTFAVNEVSKQVTVTVNGDTANEADETFTLTLSGITGGTLDKAVGTGTIVNDEASAVTSTADSGAGSLRQAILDANASGRPTTIVLDLPGADPQEIALLSNLPDLTVPMTLSIGAGKEVRIGSTTPFSFGNLTALGKTGPGSLVLGHALGNTGPATLNVGEGRLDLLADLGAMVTLNNSSLLNLGASQHLASLAMGDGSVTKLLPGGHKVLVTNLLDVGGGTLDLGDGAAIVKSLPAGADAAYNTLLAKVATGFNPGGPSWTGKGITSSSAAGDANDLTAVGIIRNRNARGGTIHTTFAGETVDANSVLLRFTYYGDANLSGTVDATDYSLADNGYNFDLHGWLNGDFDYSGAVTGVDYALIDNSFNMQGAPLAGAALQAVAPAAPDRSVDSGAADANLVLAIRNLTPTALPALAADAGSAVVLPLAARASDQDAALVQITAEPAVTESLTVEEPHAVDEELLALLSLEA